MHDSWAPDDAAIIENVIERCRLAHLERAPRVQVTQFEFDRLRAIVASSPFQLFTDSLNTRPLGCLGVFLGCELYVRPV